MDKKIKRDIERILLLAGKVNALLGKKKIHKAKRQLRKIIKYDLDELSRIQREQGAKRLLDECGIVFQDAKKALLDLDSSELFEEARQLIDEIMDLEGHQLMEITEEEKKLNKLYTLWSKRIYPLRLYHYTSQINVRRLIKKGYNPGDKPIGWDILMQAWDLVDSINWIPGGSRFFTILSPKEDYQKEKGLYVSPLKVYNKYQPTSEALYFFVKTLKEKVKQMEEVLHTSGDFEAYLRILEEYGGSKPIRDHFYPIYQKVFTKPEQIKYVTLKKLSEELENLVQESRKVVLWILARDIFRISPWVHPNCKIVLSFRAFLELEKNSPKLFERLLGMRLGDIIGQLFSNEIKLDCRIPPSLFHLSPAHELLLKKA